MVKRKVRKLVIDKGIEILSYFLVVSGKEILYGDFKVV